MSTEQVDQQAAAANQSQEVRAPFYLSVPMLTVIEEGLMSLPYRSAAPVINDLRQQWDELNRQMQAQQQEMAQQREMAETKPVEVRENEPKPLEVAEPVDTDGKRLKRSK